MLGYRSMIMMLNPIRSLAVSLANVDFALFVIDVIQKGWLNFAKFAILLTHKQPVHAQVDVQHCDYWYPATLAPGLQYTQCWIHIHCYWKVFIKNTAFIVSNVRKVITFKIVPTCSRLKGKDSDPYFNEILNGIQCFPIRKMHIKCYLQNRATWFRGQWVHLEAYPNPNQNIPLELELSAPIQSHIPGNCPTGLWWKWYIGPGLVTVTRHQENHLLLVIIRCSLSYFIKTTPLSLEFTI